MAHIRRAFGSQAFCRGIVCIATYPVDGKSSAVSNFSEANSGSNSKILQNTEISWAVLLITIVILPRMKSVSLRSDVTEHISLLFEEKSSFYWASYRLLPSVYTTMCMYVPMLQRFYINSIFHINNTFTLRLLKSVGYIVPLRRSFQCSITALRYLADGRQEASELPVCTSVWRRGRSYLMSCYAAL